MVFCKNVRAQLWRLFGENGMEMMIVQDLERSSIGEVLGRTYSKVKSYNNIAVPIVYAMMLKYPRLKNMI